MKKIMLSAMLLMLAQLTLADGLLTRNSQSAQYVRMLSRNASTDLDATFYNPAGLGHLGNGMHLSLNNQFELGEKLLASGYDYLNEPEYAETIRQLFLPSGFAVYQADKLSVSLGFGQTGGLGSINWDHGLPSFEILAARIPAALPYQVRTDYQIDGYEADVEFSGSSVFWGIQGGVTYQFTDFVSLYGGLRYWLATNRYSGSISNISLKIDGELVPAEGWIAAKSDDYENSSVQAASASTVYTGAANRVQQLITSGAGSLTLSQVQTMGYISSAEKAQIEGALVNIGYTPAQIASKNLNQIKPIFTNEAQVMSQAAIKFAATSAELGLLVSQVADRELDSQQEGEGITPILGINLTLMEKLNIGIRYEFKTSLTMTNNTKKDDCGLYPDEEEIRLEIPAHLAVGIGYKATERLEGQLSVDLNFDKGLVWGVNQRDLLTIGGENTQIRERSASGNSLGLGLGFQYSLTDDLNFSLGGHFWKPAVNESYQSDFNFINSCYTIGLGIEWCPNDQVSLDAGFSRSVYQTAEAHYFEPILDDWYIDTYNRNRMIFAIGLTYRTGR